MVYPPGVAVLQFPEPQTELNCWLRPSGTFPCTSCSEEGKAELPGCANSSRSFAMTWVTGEPGQEAPG